MNLKHTWQFTDRLKGIQTYLVLAVLFVVVHLLYSAFGVEMTGPVAWDWHLIDRPLLEDRLLESLFYLHTQPPLWNLFVAIYFCIHTTYQSMFAASMFLLLGFASYCSVFSLLRFMGIPKSLAVLSATVFMASPTFVLLEHVVGYDFPIMALVTISIVILWKFFERPSYIRALLFFSIIAVTCLTRSLFHLTYFLVMVGSIALMNRGSLKTVLLAALPGFALVFSVYVKNYLVFDRFTASTWMGMNAAKVVVRSAPLEERERWHEEGIVSETMLIDPWSEVSQYPERLRTIPERFQDIPLLSKTSKDDGYKNLHNVAYIRIADQYLVDVVRVVQHEPFEYLRGLASAWYCYLRGTDESEFLPGRNLCEPLIDAYDYVLYGKSPWPIHYATDRKGTYNLYVFLLIGLPALFVYGVMLAKKGGLSPNQKKLVVVMLINIAFVALTINFFELAENQRARFYTDSFSLILLTNVIHERLWKKAKRASLR